MFLSNEDIKWISENYLESVADCISMLYAYEKKGVHTKEELIGGCRELRLIEKYKGSMLIHMELLYKSGVLGVDAKTAGIKIREAIYSL